MIYKHLLSSTVRPTTTKILSIAKAHHHPQIAIKYKPVSFTARYISTMSMEATQGHSKVCMGGVV